jgi:broad specificity phosphatase PhoE
LLARVSGWLDSVADLGERVVAVTHPAVIRAVLLIALDTPPKSFWRIDIAPTSRTVLHYRGGNWRLRSTG